MDSISLSNVNDKKDRSLKTPLFMGPQYSEKVTFAAFATFAGVRLFSTDKMCENFGQYLTKNGGCVYFGPFCWTPSLNLLVWNGVLQKAGQ